MQCLIALLGFYVCGLSLVAVNAAFSKLSFTSDWRRVYTMRKFDSILAFRSHGLTLSQITKLNFSDIDFLRSILRKRIIPSFDFLKTILHNDEHVVAAVKRSTWLSHVNIKKETAPNIDTLHRIGVPTANIAKLAKSTTRCSCRMPAGLENHLRGSCGWATALVTLCSLVSSISVATLKRKLEVYKSFGLPKDKIVPRANQKPMIVSKSL